MLQHLFPFEDPFTSTPVINVQRDFLVKYSFSFVHILVQLNYFFMRYISPKLMLLVDFNSLLKSQVIIELPSKVWSEILQSELTSIKHLPLGTAKPLCK
jgi:hypothetical protein